ncbi:MAG: isopentenyl-diphosphate Delta-isomerase [Flavobacteriales bacterium]|nr:isopentenyl-diphosphate Delta-isomerase [Flavobacteriales bacterium]MBK7083389.1 isopentenyl-diphosphate Delta-isomerase [Flavobacteriales bacterium]MBK7751708.1 isopentenyl-diphosphate Delta-isomerase [Flavobacteriales bacterium]MBK9076444.1 isopentenyl-diphosphate Delta-isomerase [Flavobacteriales bacterium]MBK9539502.1 isopentenyl-diphosphate Delta-isomerase [Flavobacteriales bacterium]
MTGPGGVEEECVVLVDERDEVLGTMGKMDAHRGGHLHRAFSVFVFDAHGRPLLQKRAATKYHSGGLWSNACCGHPRRGETIENAARRRLNEEMGIDRYASPEFWFIYRATLPNGLIEHELDHVLFAQYDGVAEPSPDEVEQWRYADPDELTRDLAEHPERYTAWLHISWPEVLARRGARPSSAA